MFSLFFFWERKLFLSHNKAWQRSRKREKINGCLNIMPGKKNKHFFECLKQVLSCLKIAGGVK
jgi:hypothetical protein